jgi:hypothetical protein
MGGDGRRSFRSREKGFVVGGASRYHQIGFSVPVSRGRGLLTVASSMNSSFTLALHCYNLLFHIVQYHVA